MKLVWVHVTNIAVVLATLISFLGAELTAQAKANGSTQEQADAKAIEKLSQRDIAACMSNDVDTLCSLWTNDGVLIMPDTPPVVGKKAICAMLQQQKTHSNGSETTGYTEDWKEVRILGDYAWQWGEMTQTDSDSSGKRNTMRVNAIRILHRGQDGTWKVARAAVTPAGQ